MISAWNKLFAATRSYVGLKEARRVTNLVIAALLTADANEADDELKLRTDELMLDPKFDLSLSAEEWSSLLDYATQAVSTDVPDGIDYDGWVRAFQIADPSRKTLGAYATPADFAEALASAAIQDTHTGPDLRVVDPACGAGALLIACLDQIAPDHGPKRRTASLNLFGLELDPAARELACLQIWMAAGAHKEDYQAITRNIRCGNALLHDWWADHAFDVLIMNPPWESLRHRATNDSDDAERQATIERLSVKVAGSKDLPALFTAQGSGDRNLSKAFLELAPHLLKPGGRLGALIPAAFASDEGMLELRRLYLDHLAIDAWTGFENRAKAFDIDSRYKFGILSGTKSAKGTQSLHLRAFAVHAHELEAPHVLVSREQLQTVGGPVGIIPDITSKRELDVLTTMLTSGTAFFSEGELGHVRYKRELDLTLGKQKGLFSRLDQRSHSWNRDGTMTVASAGTVVPVLEGRMVGQYDFFQKSWVEGHGRTAVWRDNGDNPLGSCQPQYVTSPAEGLHHRLAICDVTSATNTRTVHATVVPDGWVCGNTAPVLRFESERAMYAGLAILNSMTFDWLARRMVSGLHLNKFYLSCMAWPALGSADIEKLAEAGCTLAASAPRPPLQLNANQVHCRVELLSSIETAVASGYGLGASDLRFMLADEPDDRRGFWRYFAAFPQARGIAARTSEMLASR